MADDTKSSYDRDEVEAALGVLVELIGVLGEMRVRVAVIGGFVPFLRLRHHADTHVGSLDVDAVLDLMQIDSIPYLDIREHLESRGYVETRTYCFERAVPGVREPVQVHFMTEEHGETASRRRRQRMQDAMAQIERDINLVDLVFNHSAEQRVEARLPNGTLDAVTVKVSDVVASLCMKGMALYDRRKPKDSYDVYYWVEHYPGGIAGLAEALRPSLGKKLVTEGLSKIRAKFLSPEHVGPTDVADFLELEPSEERDTLTRDVYERISALMDSLGVSPWEG